MFVLQHDVYVVYMLYFQNTYSAFYRTHSPFSPQLFMLTFAGICGSQREGEERDPVSTPA